MRVVFCRAFSRAEAFRLFIRVYIHNIIYIYKRAAALLVIRFHLVSRTIFDVP